MFGGTPTPSSRAISPAWNTRPAKTDLALLKKLKAAGIPVVSVFLSGRPLDQSRDQRLGRLRRGLAAGLGGRRRRGRADRRQGGQAAPRLHGQAARSVGPSARTRSRSMSAILATTRSSPMAMA
ncbi:hypothetical protein ACRAWD_11095 [Caulobacter segnis]